MIGGYRRLARTSEGKTKPPLLSGAEGGFDGGALGGAQVWKLVCSFEQRGAYGGAVIVMGAVATKIFGEGGNVFGPEGGVK